MRYMGLLQEYEPYSSDKNDETQKVMLRIMQIVMDWWKGPDPYTL